MSKLPAKTLLEPQDLVSKAYLLPWYTKKRNIVIKGSKGSGKSYFAALWHIVNMMKHPEANTLVIRKVYDTIRDSCYADFLVAIETLGVAHLWDRMVSPMKLIYKKTGQEIIFRGLDDSLKLASIRATHGYLCWVWFEEAFEITDYSSVLKVLASIRAIPPESGLWKRFTFTFNPWSQYHWLKEEFFDKERTDTLALTTTYLDNPGFTDDDRKWYEDLEQYNPIAAKVIVHGEWGVSEGLIYNNWSVENFDPAEIAQQEGVKAIYGLDFGYATSYTAFASILVNPRTHNLWICDEIYAKGMTNVDIAKLLNERGYGHAHIIADCAEPKSIFELKQGLICQSDGEYVRYVLPNIEATMKGKDSVSNGIQRMQSFIIHVLPSCRNAVMELSAYAWEIDKDGKYTGKPEKEYDHLMDAIRYALMYLLRPGKGHVAVAKGIDGYTAPKALTSGSRSKRVVATHE